MNKWTLASLKAKAEQIEAINSEGEAYKSVLKFFDTCSKEELETVAGAGIKWFSSIAKSRLSLAI